MFGAYCDSAEREQETLERLYQIEQKLDIHSAPPCEYEPLRDPFNLHDEACQEFYAKSSDPSHRRGKQQANAKDEEYREKDDDDDDDNDGGDDGDHDDDDDYEDE
jgi:hypothetical protein